MRGSDTVGDTDGEKRKMERTPWPIVSQDRGGRWCVAGVSSTFSTDLPNEQIFFFFQLVLGFF